MGKLPNIKVKKSILYKNTMNETGDMCNAYQPFQNLQNSAGTLGDFTTTNLNFDMRHPVDILTLDAYDGAVNLVLNDGKNVPKLVNSRFSILDDNKFLIPDHTGYKDTNIYNDTTFDIDTALKAICKQIPKISFEGLLDNSGKMSCGSYTFYFKLADADGNETEVVAESGIVQCHIGLTNDPKTMRMGMQDENSGKAIKFTLTNIDSGFDYVHVLFARSSSGVGEKAETTYSKIIYDYPVYDQECHITITGNEDISGISQNDLYTDFADIQSVKTLEILNNILMFGNVDKPIHDWEALRKMSWKIIPIPYFNSESIGDINPNYQSSDSSNRVYYTAENVYERVGYWPDEIYRFGIVYIFEDNSMSRVFNILGIDMSKWESSIYDTLSYDKLFFHKDGSELEYTSEDCYFRRGKVTIDEDDEVTAEQSTNDSEIDNDYKLNSKGVIKFPKHSVLSASAEGVITPKPMGILFKMTHIAKENIEDNTDYKTILKKHKIKGFFFVRQKRVPTILALGVMIELTDKDRGSLPILRDNINNRISQSFLGSDYLLYNEGSSIKLSNSGLFTTLAMLVPDAEMQEATFNNIFTSGNFTIEKVGSYKFKWIDSDYKHCVATTAIQSFGTSTKFKVKLTNIPEDSKALTNGKDYFSTLAGSEHEPYKTKDVKLSWRYTKPLDLTDSLTIVRGKWGPYVGVSNPNETGSCPLKYGDVYNIKMPEYYEDEEIATKLDFQKRFNSGEHYYAICDRTESVEKLICYRGDCFQSMFTHRMFRNFIDPELPTNDKIVNPSTWMSNYGVRCTAKVLAAGHSNLTSDDDGWYIDSGVEEARKNMMILALVMFLTANIIGATNLLISAATAIKTTNPSKMGLSDLYVYYHKNGKWYTGDYTPTSFSLCSINWGTKTEVNVTNKNIVPEKGKLNYYLVAKYYTNFTAADDIETDASWSETSGGESSGILNCELAVNDKGEPIPWDANNTDCLYPNGYANEIVLAFETYSGNQNPGFNLFAPFSSLIKIIKYGSNGGRPTRKKVNPKELEAAAGGLNLKAMFKSDDNWELHGLASMNRSDINAVGLGQWITFPICSTHNLALRDIDFSNAIEETSFLRKRSFYPLCGGLNRQDPLRDSNVLNAATGISLPAKKYIAMDDVPFLKQEYFTRIFNSLTDSALSLTNEFKVIFNSAYKDYTKLYGSITKLVSAGNVVIVVFKHGIGAITVPSSNATNATEYLSEIQMLSKDIGSMWKDSIIKTELGIYGVDSVAKCIWMMSSLGSVPLSISHMRVEKFLIDNLDMSEFTTKPYVGHINIKAHWDAFKKDVIFTYYNDTPVDSNGDKIDFEDIDTKLDHWVAGKTWSLCYNEEIQMFQTFYDWIPLESANIDNIWFTFDRDGANSILSASNKYRQLSFKTYLINLYTSKSSGSTIFKLASDELNHNSDKCTIKFGKYKKFIIDNAFSSNTVMYFNKNIYGYKTEFLTTDVNELEKDKYYIYTIYVKVDANTNLNLVINASEYDSKSIPTFNINSTKDLDIKALHSGNSNDIRPNVKIRNELIGIPVATYTVTPGDWKFISLFIRPDDTKYYAFSLTPDYSTEDWDYPTYYYAEPKLLEFTLDEVADNELLTLYFGNVTYGQMQYKDDLLSDTNKLNSVFLREYNNSLKLWKHGQAGVYDNQGKIKPTTWYGKLHEFNFEFIVNEKALQLKIFNNLLIISNKAEPYKFEYEVVGEGYDWYENKAVILWCNDHVGKDLYGEDTEEPEYKNATLDDAYKYVLTHTYGDLLKYNSDFPSLFNRDDSYIIKKLPYLQIELAARKGTKGLPEYVLKDPKGYDAYKDNTSQTILVYDELLNEYKVHTESLGNDVKKYGRVRGNMEYLEDEWKVEIRPIAFKYAYITTIPGSTPVLSFSELQETRHRDKYIRIKVRYTGLDLVVIQSLLTLFNDSYA